MPQLWEVIGGGDKGGLLVRDGKFLKSAKLSERLSTGAIVEELAVAGERLQYKLVDGKGPEKGWVNHTLDGKVLVVQKEAEPAPAKAVPSWMAAMSQGFEEEEEEEAPKQTEVDKSEVDRAPAAEPEPAEPEVQCKFKFPEMYFNENNEALPKRNYEDWWNEYDARLQGGELVGPLNEYPAKALELRACAPGTPAPVPGEYIDKSFVERKKTVQEVNFPKLMGELSSFKMPPPWQRKTKQQLEKEAKAMLPGDMYGIDVPPTLGDVEKMGAPWLTKALHAAGTLPKDNTVTQVLKFKRLPTTTKDAAGGAGPKAFLTVKYAKPDPELHTELFVKLPWAVEGTKEMGGDSLWRFKISGQGDSEFQECSVYRFLGPVFPFKIPKYYFADICRANTNYILVTEKVLFGGTGAYLEGKKRTNFAAYEVLPVAEKYFDFNLPRAQQYEMYYCIMRAQARMAAWDVLHYWDTIPTEFRGFAMCPPPVGTFDWPVKATEKQRGIKLRMSNRMVELWNELLQDKGKMCFAAEVTSKGFVDALGAATSECGMWQDAVQLYPLLFPQLVACQHTNLQSDNAFFWRTDTGEMDAGIIDWGGFGPRPICQGFLGSITSCEGDMLFEHEVGYMRCFCDEYLRESGIRFDFMELLRQWHLCYSCMYLLSMSVNIEQEIFRQVPREEWATIKSLNDPRVIGNWNTRCYAFMTKSALRYMYLGWVSNGKKRLHMHETFLEWRDFWQKKGMT
mmetsp:Transcript_50563/g.110353  ORF Transcript_50563/g.110353 Transcript_50563/m.110353 type:complete len:735 (-) Transcript_50563:196-2400(-)